MKILLVDDHALFLEGIRIFLEVNDINVIGTAKSGEEALTKVEVLKPELILMDVQMAECDGIETTRMIKREYPEMKIVMLTASEDEDSLFAAMQAGAVGYLIKSMDPEQFLRQLFSLREGEVPLAPGLAKRLLGEFSRRRQVADELSDESEPELTRRQTEVLQLLTDGWTYKEIALRLDLKEVTVKYHVREILSKLHLSNRTQLIAHASRLRLNGKK
ncbi:Transcriptional regulatory protein DegU [Sporomusa ovata DSM 2662]|uniref:Putative two-component system response regulator n=1 Tax=Sporomusa ovata TaxID=2378 RepID=A0A0U1L0R0_9FIRM|nr:response regulator transcription factor [Sporomusa ovata]EQB27407.1 two component transcriptional regulator, LuxR family [Sporomusa ovata DSM 2662]CQR73251.1 putative two-component system response regulator [Sporomusa ovata]